MLYGIGKDQQSPQIIILATSISAKMSHMV